ncbi:TPA: NosR [Neisseria meningitidis]|uniref:hypothetical protein n=1 Tax=Neisseria meningitidis TaxID=487 RepID=UPI00027C9557|nr:hypothetical protein [Neisseria meningitidis]EJU74957.1 putative regulatory protein NosR [Neisseria meningitidis NM2657]
MSCFSIKRMSAFRARITAFFAAFVFLTAFFAAFVFLTAALPAYAERLPDFLAKIQPSEIFPGADRYSKPEGKPMVARVYKGDEQLGLVYITTDAVNTRGYSSKPIDTLMALANDGTIAGAKLVDHHESIMLIGIPHLPAPGRAIRSNWLPAYIKPNFTSTNRLRLKGLPTVLQPSKGTGAVVR